MNEVPMTDGQKRRYVEKVMARRRKLAEGIRRAGEDFRKQFGLGTKPVGLPAKRKNP